ncbi:glucose-1-phosphate thymidylyltransferase [Ruaniaceae bacterium KH17]|nr:glucose-1-phosphate thymidylyltransferase [Ruaniaceae bacterium KH17]
MNATHDPVTTAVIMARGLGTRMRADNAQSQLSGDQAAMAAKGLKSMIDVGRPFLDHVISEAADAGIADVILVIGPEHTEIREYYANLPMERVSVSFAIQEKPLGTGDAVHSAREAVGDRRFLLINSDNFYPTSVIAALAHTPGHSLAGFSKAGLVAKGNIEAERIAAFALIETEGTELREIHEKPNAGTIARLGEDAPVSMNCFVFTPRIFDFTANLTPSSRGELEVQDAVRGALAAGGVFTVVPTDEGVLDLSSRTDISSVVDALAAHEVTL